MKRDIFDVRDPDDWLRMAKAALVVLAAALCLGAGKCPDVPGPAPTPKPTPTATPEPPGRVCQPV
jgi:hypothetical protein